MIYTVTFNPSLDYIVSVKDFKTGRVNRTSTEIMFPGGKGINVSIVLKNLGYDSIALGFTAGFTGEEIIKQLRHSGVKNDFITVDDGLSRINVKIRSDEESEINGQGPVITGGNIEILYEKLELLKAGDILVLAGSIPDVMPQSIYMDIMKHLENKDIRIVVDATKALLLNVIPHHPFLVKPNNHELGEMFGVTITDKKDVISYAGKLKDMGAENVLISMAGKGAVLLSADGHIYEAEAPKGKVVNSVGAGDSMVAGFISGYLATGDYKEAFKYGLCTGSASAFSEKLAEKEDVERLMKVSQVNVIM
ncbi:MAG: 1-phosphofructokinase [Eubacteriales bacterium]|nr:1-phosphofructokinase [Eubacteriales bacterium]